jgi:hypothetical protein
MSFNYPFVFFSDYGLGIFRSLGWYLQITPLVSSDKYLRSNQGISKGNNSHKSKDRQCNVQKFGDVKAEIDHGKTNRVQSIQWPKE